MPLHSVHLASAHAAADPRIFDKECRTLAAAGHRVTFVVPHARDEVADGVEIAAVPLPATGRERLTRTVRAVVRRAEAVSLQASVWHVHDAELLPYVLPHARRRRVVYDAHEDTPRQVRHWAWVPRAMRPAVGAAYAGLEALAGRWCAGLVAATPTIAARYPADKTVVVRNVPRLDTLGTGPPPSERPPVVAYVGAITRPRGTEEMIRAAGLLPDGAELHLAGTPFPATLPDDLSAVPGAERTHWLGHVDRDGVARLLATARVGLVVLHDTPQYRDAYPTKLFEYMAAGVPAVVSDLPLWRQMVEDAACGLLVDPRDPSALAGACAALLADDACADAMAAAGRAAARDRYSWDAEASVLLAFYDALAAGRPPGAS